VVVLVGDGTGVGDMLMLDVVVLVAVGVIDGGASVVGVGGTVAVIDAVAVIVGVGVTVGVRVYVVVAVGVDVEVEVGVAEGVAQWTSFDTCPVELSRFEDTTRTR